MAKYLSIQSRSEATALKNPKELCCYSRDIDGQYWNDERSLSYYYLPDSEVDANMDLNAGFKHFRKFDPKRSREFDGFLGALEDYERQHGKVKAHLVTWRGVLTKLLTLQYNLHEPLELYGVWFDGSVFLQLGGPVQDEQELDETHKRLMYSGYKFEALATLPQPLSQVSRLAIEKNSKKTVNDIEQYCSVVKTGVGKKRVVLAGEVDCCWDYKPETGSKADNPLRHYVELKTSKVISEPKQAINFEKKLFRTWAQTFLIGINKIVYAFRDDNLIVKSVEEYRTDEIPVLLKNNNEFNTNPRKINCVDSIKWYGAVIDFIVDNFPQQEDAMMRIVYNPAEKNFKMEPVDQGPDILTTKFREWRKAGV